MAAYRTNHPLALFKVKTVLTLKVLIPAITAFSESWTSGLYWPETTTHVFLLVGKGVRVELLVGYGESPVKIGISRMVPDLISAYGI